MKTLRCVTGALCGGIDTQKEDWECPCAGCQRWLGRQEGFAEAREMDRHACIKEAEAHDKAARNSTGRDKRYHLDAAHEIRRIAKTIRALQPPRDESRQDD